MRFLAVFDGCAEIMAGANERKRNGWGFLSSSCQFPCRERRFAKTGSGQAQVKVTKKRSFYMLANRRESFPRDVSSGLDRSAEDGSAWLHDAHRLRVL